MNNTLTFRPSKENNTLLDDLAQLSKKDNRTLNNYIETVLINHVKKNKVEPPISEEKLISLFLSNKPHLLSYEYRKSHSRYKSDRQTLAALLKKGIIKQISKDNKTIVFKYTGQ